MLFISSCIFVFIWKSFPAAWIKPFNIFLCHVTDRYSQFLFTKKFINLTFILSEFFHSIEDFRLAFWSCYSITFKTTVLFSSKKSPASDHCCSQDNLFFFFNSAALRIFLHLLKYYIPYLLLLSTILLNQNDSLVYFTFSCLFSVLTCPCSFWACSSDLSISSQMLSPSISNILRNLYWLFLNLIITFVGLKIISFLWVQFSTKLSSYVICFHLFGVGGSLMAPLSGDLCVFSIAYFCWAFFTLLLLLVHHDILNILLWCYQTLYLQNLLYK